MEFERKECLGLLETVRKGAHPLFWSDPLSSLPPQDRGRYKTILKHHSSAPTDLSKVKASVMEGVKYRTMREFRDDVAKVFKNSIIFNINLGTKEFRDNAEKMLEILHKWFCKMEKCTGLCPCSGLGRKLRDLLRRTVFDEGPNPEAAFSFSPLAFLSNDKKLKAKYSDLVANPVDLGTMTCRFYDCEYESLDEFKDDIEAICSNCETFWSSQNLPEYAKLGVALREHFAAAFKKHVDGKTFSQKCPHFVAKKRKRRLSDMSSSSESDSESEDDLPIQKMMSPAAAPPPVKKSRTSSRDPASKPKKKKKAPATKRKKAPAKGKKSKKRPATSSHEGPARKKARKEVMTASELLSSLNTESVGEAMPTKTKTKNRKRQRTVSTRGIPVDYTPPTEEELKLTADRAEQLILKVQADAEKRSMLREGKELVTEEVMTNTWELPPPNLPAWMEKAVGVIDALAARRQLSFFLMTPAVQLLPEIRVQYLKRIPHPMDFGTIRRMLIAESIPTFEQFLEMSTLVFDNVLLFNNGRSAEEEDIRRRSEHLRFLFNSFAYEDLHNHVVPLEGIAAAELAMVQELAVLAEDMPADSLPFNFDPLREMGYAVPLPPAPAPVPSYSPSNLHPFTVKRNQLRKEREAMFKTYYCEKIRKPEIKNLFSNLFKRLVVRRFFDSVEDTHPDIVEDYKKKAGSTRSLADIRRTVAEGGFRNYWLVADQIRCAGIVDCFNSPSGVFNSSMRYNIASIKSTGGWYHCALQAKYIFEVEWVTTALQLSEIVHHELGMKEMERGWKLEELKRKEKEKEKQQQLQAKLKLMTEEERTETLRQQNLDELRKSHANKERLQQIELAAREGGGNRRRSGGLAARRRRDLRSLLMERARADTEAAWRLRKEEAQTAELEAEAMLFEDRLAAERRRRESRTALQPDRASPVVLKVARSRRVSRRASRAFQLEDGDG